MLVPALLAGGCAGAQKEFTVTGDPPDYARAIAAIARDIESLEDEFPQLAEFRASKHCDTQRLVISYGFRTHRSQRRGGWAAAVPNPDATGVWFHIDFHDPDSMAQIHTQPVVPDMRYGGKKVMFLILEGEATRKLAGELHRILVRRGVKTTNPRAR